jgi:PIN domain nuclease of toxin-antitoxin system
LGRRAVILLDTHAWLWWAGDHSKLSVKLRRRLDHESALAISAISCWEAAMLIEHGRLRLAPDARSGIREATSIPKLRLIGINESIAIEAGLLGAGFHGDPADRLIVATALMLHVPLVTKDDRIRSSGLIETLW